ncbi:TPA: phage tail protein [Salmonella enterica subsp. enterica serovar Waycross]|nr:phage tail protein [Salmonella enterica subsp. enterica serovar Waycross]HEC6604813.1 phage tail protein [Salmonella enterica subsp. enterica serovar Waycross]
MSAGTLTLTNNSDIVTGIGTSFATELDAGDFVVVTVGGVPYTLPVKSVESDTDLTLVSVYTGPTQSGAAWSAVPRVALNMVTAALVAQSAEALRGLNYDKQNWQQVYSTSGNITVKLPDGSTYNGPSWKYLSDNMASKTDGAVPVNQGGTGSTTAQGARKNLGLGSSATRDVGISSGNVMEVGSFGIGGRGTVYSMSTLGEMFVFMRTYGGGIYRNDGAVSILGRSIQYSPSLFFGANDTFGFINVAYNTGIVSVAANTDSGISGGFGYAENVLYGTANTTTSSDGTLKIASPIIRIFADGRYDVNRESEGCNVSHIGPGKYLITGCLGLNSDAVWGGIDGGFEIPIDRNKQPRIWLDYEVNADGSIIVKTYHRTHPNSPDFARNEIDGLTNGEPVDIPSDSFVSVRVEMPPNSICNQRQKEAQEEIEKSANNADDKTESEDRT